LVSFSLLKKDRRMHATGEAFEQFCPEPGLANVTRAKDIASGAEIFDPD
jgi:hypothetical protein